VGVLPFGLKSVSRLRVTSQPYSLITHVTSENRPRKIFPTELSVVVLGGLAIVGLVIEPKVHGFKPGREQWIFKGDQVCRTISFEGK
jgi:hypothetical protein